MILSTTYQMIQAGKVTTCGVNDPFTRVVVQTGSARVFFNRQEWEQLAQEIDATKEHLIETKLIPDSMVHLAAYIVLQMLETAVDIGRVQEVVDLWAAKMTERQLAFFKQTIGWS